MLGFGRFLFSLLFREEELEEKNDEMMKKKKEEEEKMDEMMMKKKKDTERAPELITLVFSWSIPDIMNANLYRNEVKQIPDTFSSPDLYLKSFIHPLIEEIHADLYSNFTTLSRAPASQVFDVRQNIHFKPSKRLLYDMLLIGGSNYEPEFGDLIALTEVKPRQIDDLNRPTRPYLIALVQGKDDDDGDDDDDSKWIQIRSSMPIEFRKEGLENRNRGDKLFVVYLTNLTTNMRIWKALHSGVDGGNMKMINSVMRVNPSLEGNCDLCSSNESSDTKETLDSIELDESQKDAVLNCIATASCDHVNSVKLIWGPPGTGKTNTISSLVLCLLRMKCRTLTCAPTNIALLGVAKRLMGLLSGTLEYETYGLGDIVLFGNGKRMNINDHDDLFDVFLDHRVYVLTHCFAPLKGWKGSLQSMIGLLEDPENQYQRYKVEELEKDESDDEEAKNEKENENAKGPKNRNIVREFIVRELKKSKRKNPKNRPQCHAINQSLITFEEFFTTSFSKFRHQLCLCITGLYTHMPTSYLPFEVAKNMVRVLDMLQELQGLINRFVAASEWSKDVLNGDKMIRGITIECLEVLKILSKTFSVPNFFEHRQIKTFCLQNACLVFCTASSSAKLNIGGKPIQLVIIDEAAQLKECESCIPLQLPGLKHAVLVGDEKQLPAMVQSKICKRANFGRSLFERLVVLGHSKHLLNVQYRMHPSISLFPNMEFYGKQIRDGSNVVERSHKRSYLSGSIFGSYSFIDITVGKEEFDNRHSLRNMVEVSVLVEILSKLHKESIMSKQKVRVGCISPYKAQVNAIQERIGKTYSTDSKDIFSVNVRSVDGFQGGEEDLIIISTVRCNGNGTVGFLSNCQRTNVALTRAKYCLWMLGNAATLLNSCSVWKKLVLNAKRRGCFYNAYEDKSLSLAISNALVEHGSQSSIFNTNSVIFKTSKWKICFSNEFQDSMKKYQELVINKEVISLVVKLANGWHQTPRYEDLNNKEGISSQLMQWCAVKGPLILIWTIDIIQEKSMETQVLKIWDVLPRKEMPKLAKRLDSLLGTTP